MLELTERYEDRVDLIVGVLARMQQLENQDAAASDGSVPRVTYVLAAEPGEGASSANPPIDAADEVWRRIDIRAQQGASSSVTRLEFTSIGRLARAERLLVDVERTIVDPLLAEAIDRHADPHISGTLYELLIPHELKGELGSAENLHLLVDEATADWPLELLRPRADEEDRRIPMALRVGVLRQFRETEGLRYNVRRASSNNALVIGNPPTPGAADLPGAAEECMAAAEVLAKHSFDVDSLIWKMNGRFVGDRAPGSTGTSPLDALHALLNGDWRVLHIAAHGAFTDDSTTTGVLLGSLRLTANTFSKMSVVPDLVLLNACHLGRIGASPSLAGANRTAASIGRALLQLGVRAVAVAGWAVDDDAAKEFAARLIEGLAEGDDFGAAVTNARQEAWKKAPHSLTWGAYQCYGDPGFSLAPRPRRPGGDVHTVGELRRRTRRLASTASDQGRSASSNTIARRDEIGEQLEKLEQRAGELRAEEVYADLAEVWADLLDFDHAIRLYRSTLAQGGSSTPVKAIEQLGNLLSRRARHRAQEGTSQDVTDDQEEAARWLQLALDLGRSGERLALMGGFHKRTAAMMTGDERADHLRQAIQLYYEAHRTTNKAYHELNWRQLVAIARLNGITVVDEPAIESVDEPGAHTLPPERTTTARRAFRLRSRDSEQLLAAGGSGRPPPHKDPHRRPTGRSHWRRFRPAGLVLSSRRRLRSTRARLRGGVPAAVEPP